MLLPLQFAKSATGVSFVSQIRPRTFAAPFKCQKSLTSLVLLLEWNLNVAGVFSSTKSRTLEWRLVTPKGPLMDSPKHTLRDAQPPSGDPARVVRRRPVREGSLRSNSGEEFFFISPWDRQAWKTIPRTVSCDGFTKGLDIRWETFGAKTVARHEEFKRIFVTRLVRFDF